MGIIFDYKHLEKVVEDQKIFVEIPSLAGFPELVQGFTTRFGGVSTGDYATLNLNFNRPDPKENVIENFRILGRELNVSLDNMVLSCQVHDNKVLPVDVEHAGMGITRERSYSSADGLASNNTGLMLVTYYADCVPLYFYDPHKKVMALSHSGWRGTALDIAGKTMDVLLKTYQCNPEDIYVSFGPHIKKCCFEVDNDVAEIFRSSFRWAKSFIKKRDNHKWHIDLEGIITRSMLRRQVKLDHISGCNICTKCNRHIFFSHRGSKGKTGTGAAFMMIRG